MPLKGRFDLAIDLIDRANAEDPNIESVHGEELPKALVYGRRMSAWLHRLYPDASDSLKLAARSQHIRRWTIARNTYPMDRVGYLRWRTDLKKFHAETAAEILAEAGYDDHVIESVKSLLRKEGLRENPETQALEDVACLVFLENHFAEFAGGQDDEKVIGIVRKTWAKMSDGAHAAALALTLPEAAKSLIERALST